MSEEKQQVIVNSRLDGLGDTTDRLSSILGADDDAVAAEQRARDEGTVLERLAALEDQLDRIEGQLDAIQDLGREKSTKDEKIAALVRYAQNVADDETGGVVLLKAKDIKGVTGVCRRYAYDLMDDLPEEYEWALDRDDLKQYGELEIAKGKQDRALAVDLEILHSDAESVNKFTTRTTAKGVSV